MVPGSWSLAPFRVLLLACLVSAVCAACGRSAARIDPAVMDDVRITAQVKTALLNDQQILATKIDVTTIDGVVTLSGTVGSRAEEERAITLTRQTPGVKDVKSALRTGG